MALILDTLLPLVLFADPGATLKVPIAVYSTHQIHRFKHSCSCRVFIETESRHLEFVFSVGNLANCCYILLMACQVSGLCWWQSVYLPSEKANPLPKDWNCKGVISQTTVSLGPVLNLLKSQECAWLDPELFAVHNYNKLLYTKSFLRLLPVVKEWAL